MAFTRKFTKDGKIDLAYKKFGRGKSAGISIYDSGLTKYCYIHIRDIDKNKQVSIGIDEYQKLIDFREELMSLNQKILEENGVVEEVNDDGKMSKVDDDDDDDMDLDDLPSLVTIKKRQQPQEGNKGKKRRIVISDDEEEQATPKKAKK